MKGHAPFTTVGALLGLGFMLFFKDVSKPTAGAMFNIFHPAHVLLSAMVTASLFRLHAKGRNFLLVLIVGYVGAVGVATLSDSVIPFLGESVLGVAIPTHADMHPHAESETLHDDPEHEGHDADTGKGNDSDDAHDERRHKIHIGFIEDWYIVNPAAVLGVIIACIIPRTKFPHAAHVLISTWASSSHILMNMETAITLTIGLGMFVVLFLAVWLPCCISDIIFPLLFVKSDIQLTDVCACRNHALHSHPHTHEHTDECEGGAES
ncbi:MAG: hypothetical protein DRP66_04055 [Planctomycetota bacterium]|nr:MAG: hypothetical protein DRP66_04055 [Planctomycetota bacterium]